MANDELEEERKAFEASMRKTIGDSGDMFWRDVEHPDCYHYADVEAAWRAWQAAKLDAKAALGEESGCEAGQPIDTAPKDTEVLVYFGPLLGWKSAILIDRRDDGQYVWCVDDNKHGPFPVRGYQEPFPTHWMELPGRPLKTVDRQPGGQTESGHKEVSGD